MLYYNPGPSLQGETFNEPYTIYDWKILDVLLREVALARSTDTDLAIFSKLNNIIEIIIPLVHEFLPLTLVQWEKY